MAGFNDFSTTANSNASVGSINWSEGQQPSTVNNSARQLMADIRYELGTISSDLTAGATTDIGATQAGTVVVIGNSTIGSFGTTGTAGLRKRIKVTGTPTISCSTAGAIRGPTNANIVCQANDCFDVLCEASDQWRITSYLRADGSPVNAILSAPVISGQVTGTYSLGGTPTLSSSLLVGGSVDIGSSSAGVANLYFGNSANALSVYSEGSWTPTLAGATAAGTNTYSIQVGRYIRVGNLVHAWGRCDLSAKDVAMSGNVLISGLPFTSSNVNNLETPGIIRFATLNLSSGYTAVVAEVSHNTTNAQVIQCGDNVAAQNVDSAGVSDSTSLFFTLVYRTA